MKLLFENWRNFVELSENNNKLNEEVAEYIPGTSAYKMRKAVGGKGALDYIKDGFSRFIKSPEQFDKMVAATKQNFAKILNNKLQKLSKTPEFLEFKSKVTSIGTNKQKLNEDLAAATIADLTQAGIPEEEIEKLRQRVREQTTIALVESAESALGTVAPPKIKNWLIRFISKFIGSFVFGFIDNFIMVIAGSEIDAQFGGIAGSMVGSAAAPMMAAGLGNTVSDAIGELASNSIDDAMDKMGLNAEKVTDEQVAAGPMWMRFLDKQASVIGIVLGCLVGMFPLFLEEQNTNEIIRSA